MHFGSLDIAYDLYGNRPRHLQNVEYGRSDSMLAGEDQD